MPSTTPALYFPGSQKRVMVLDHQNRFLTSVDHPLKDDIARVVLVNNSYQMETLHINGHRCNTSDLVQLIGAHMMASTDLQKSHLPAYQDQAAAAPDGVEEKRFEGNGSHYIPRHQVDALTWEVLSDIQKNHRAAKLKKMERRLTNDAVVMASTDLEKGHLPACQDKATTAPYDNEEKCVGGNQHIYLPRHETDALMLTQDVLYDIHYSHRTARIEQMEQQIRMDATVLLILKILMVLSVLTLMMLYAACIGLNGVKVDCSRPGPLGLISWCWMRERRFE